jgi:NitT/TauT family transport system substrate-binding protein
MEFKGCPKMKSASSLKKYDLKTVILLLVLLIIIISWACSKEDGEGPTGSFEKMSLGVSSPDYPLFFAFILLAKEQGFFKEYGLDMTYKFYPHGVGSLKALQNGDVDMALGAEFPFVIQNLEGGRMKLVASIAQVDVLELIARRDSGILEPADLRGKRVALIMESQLEFFLSRFLLKYELTLKDIETLDLPPPGIEKSIMEGAADAVVFREPMASRIKAELGDNWISWPVQDKQAVHWIVACKDTYVSRHSKTIERFLKAVEKAELFYSNDARKAIDIIIRKGNLDKTLFERMLPLIEYKLSLEKALLIALEDEARWLIENQRAGTEEVPNYLDQIYFGALESVKPDAISIIH